jgi:hypothetical protein
MSKQEGREFKRRWELINRFIADEIRNTSRQTKLRQMRTIFNSAHLFHHTEAAEELEEVRQRWIRLKKEPHG